MQEDPPFTLARVDVHAIAPARLRRLGFALLRLNRIAVWPPCLSVLMRCGAEASGVTVCGGCWIDRQFPATECARDIIATRAWVSSPLELRFRDFFRRLWLSLSLSLVLSVSVSLRDRLPPPFTPTSRNLKWMGPCAVRFGVGSLSPSGCPW